MKNLSPVRLFPAYKDYLWGGEKLKAFYGKNTSVTPLAESWELSAHPDGQCLVYAPDGLPFTEYLEQLGQDGLGDKYKVGEAFPILIKFIDAKGDLSVQVHPDDAYALANEGQYGKTEMWYVLECEKGAFLYYGFKEKITKGELYQSIENGTLTDLMNRVEVKAGDVFFIPAGTVHAIGKGMVICEIQQNSNVTYRVYDYDRRDKNGNKRPLHVEKALEVASLDRASDHLHPGDGEAVLLASCDKFTVTRLTLQGKMCRMAGRESFVSCTVTRGEGRLIWQDTVLEFSKGDSLFVPANAGEFCLEGNAEILETVL